MNAIKIWSTCSPYKVWTPQLVYNVTQDHDAALHLIFGFHEHASMLQHSRQEYSTTGFVNKQIKCSYKKLQLRVDQQNPEMILLLHISVFRLLNTVSILNKI